MKRRPQAKDISDDECLFVVRRSLEEDQRNVPADLWDVQRRLISFPPKVVLAKLRALVRKGKLRGCCCGCRGDFQIIDVVVARTQVGG